MHAQLGLFVAQGAYAPGAFGRCHGLGLEGGGVEAGTCGVRAGLWGGACHWARTGVVEVAVVVARLAVHGAVVPLA
jgi:hypothetical protein